MPALRAAAAGSRALGGDGQKTRAVARDLFDAAARHRTELVHAPFYGVRCVILQTSAPTRSIHAKSGRARSEGEAMRCYFGRVANSGAGRRMGCARPQFHTLLTSGRPKQSASIRFYSHTVHAPAKPKPLRSRSMASNPWMVRRAVWKAWKQPTRGMGRLTRK